MNKIFFLFHYKQPSLFGDHLPRHFAWLLIKWDVFWLCCLSRKCLSIICSSLHFVQYRPWKQEKREKQLKPDKRGGKVQQDVKGQKEGGGMEASRKMVQVDMMMPHYSEGKAAEGKMGYQRKVPHHGGMGAERKEKERAQGNTGSMMQR